MKYFSILCIFFFVQTSIAQHDMPNSAVLMAQEQLPLLINPIVPEELLLDSGDLIGIPESQVSTEQPPCDQWARAVNTDQKTMVMDVVFSPEALHLNIRQIYSVHINNYVSWRGEQRGCVANIFHRANLEVESLEAQGQLCTHRLTIHRFDQFLTLPSESEYKIRDYQKVCSSLTSAQLDVVGSCMVRQCPTAGNVRTYPDYTDNCECKVFGDIIRFIDESAHYEDFFNPLIEFEKPEGVETPFN